MKIKTLILSSILATSNVFAAGQFTPLTTANLEEHTRQSSPRSERRDIDQESNPSTIAAAMHTEKRVVTPDTESDTTSENDTTEDYVEQEGEAGRNPKDYAKEALDQVATASKKLGVFLAENTAKHGALIAVEAGLTYLTVNFAHELLTTPIKDIDSGMFVKVATPALFLGAQTLFSSLLLPNPLKYFLGVPLFKSVSIICQASYMMGLANLEVAIFATAMNLIMMLGGEAETPLFSN